MKDTNAEKYRYVEQLGKLLNDDEKKEFASLLAQKGLTKKTEEESKTEALNLKSKYSNQNLKLRQLSGGLQNFITRLNAKIEPPVYPHYIKCLLMAICFVVGLYYGYIYSLDLIKNKPQQSVGKSYIASPSDQQTAIQTNIAKKQPVQTSPFLHAIKGIMNKPQTFDTSNSAYLDLLDSLLDQPLQSAQASSDELSPEQEEVYTGDIQLYIPKKAENKIIDYKYASLEIKKTGLSKVSIGGPYARGETLFIELHLIKVDFGSGFSRKVSDKNANILYNIDDVVLGSLNGATGKFRKLARIPSEKSQKPVEFLCEENFNELFLLYKAKPENNFTGFLEYYYWKK